ncbi:MULTISPECIES: type II secretion system ATPase GspE [unclassified Pseudomonas]|uniref:type II secretion system ATPase GspE n=1 Tax=unclassified Pseudomonas TaxID=196821 RepID=UPI00129631CC|nr:MULTISPECIES: type II secretion system ATPase GspE [unclassified Pseudomonas]MQT43332.1 type II secretion system protein GspE [Pseudomonas sp. FSL R10-0765]MQT53116.1 type II secretion system protein GspE [Pseudomonas sp. FSL R10-2398]MQU01896.1 type II secretion system protein GspE [Pseudomonas sp. FSL R10-2245]MQU10314.1 type II secretion system protein GspE [Pseudomonas sp. FSL R10-2189]MQU39165.1 type II secretion system protein GspE [Pseudomonas sp. FSL R10-2172]
MSLPPVRLPYSFARRFGVLLDTSTQPASLLIRSDTPLTVLAEVQRWAGVDVQLQRLPDALFSERLTLSYSAGQSAAEQVAQGLDSELDLMSVAEQVPQTADLLEQEGDAPIIRLINALLREAMREKASDVHLETFEHYLSVRMRIDGQLREVLRPKRELANLLVSRIKVMARLDIAEKRVPQDGRISLRLAGHEVDVRVSTLPSAHGERVVMRLLDKQAGRLDLQCLGMPAATLSRFEHILARPHGIFLVTGPTGSGKTTSLYAALSHLNAPTRNILTVEDPVEYHLPGIGQTPVNSKANMTFARGLRAILRQDPDVVMVGEIRDHETADIAVQASLTGHLVLSTLHTNSAVGAVTRLVDMGVDAYLLASSLVGVLAQRLLRTLCADCKTPYRADPQQCQRLGLDPQVGVTLYQPQGCRHCQQGYRGRTGIYELVGITPALAELIHQGASEPDLIRVAREHAPSLFQDGQRLVLQGLTSFDELLRVTLED